MAIAPVMDAGREIREKKGISSFASVEDTCGLPAVGTGRTHLSGELWLLSTILADALRTALRLHRVGDSEDRREAEAGRQEAIEWIFSDDESWPCSFLVVCRILKLEPSSIRAHVGRRLRDGARRTTGVRGVARMTSRTGRGRRPGASPAGRSEP